MSESKNKVNKRKFINAIIFAAVAGYVIYLITQNPGVFVNIAIAVIGFGMVVLVHEFGHFIFAKITGIKVEAFSIGFSPILIGIRRTVNGYKVRILPKFFPKEAEKLKEQNAQQSEIEENEQAPEDTDGRLTFTIGKKAKPGETEYRVGLIPFGGFVQMLGQEDTKVSKGSDDPRSYANKPVFSRMLVIAAGVIFNVIGAALVFMTVFMIGIDRTPPVVGGVMTDSPAQKAGLQAGDEIIQIGDQTHNLEFMDIGVAAALSDMNQPVELTVLKSDGEKMQVQMTAELLPDMPIRLFGVMPPLSLKIDKVDDPNALRQTTGLQKGDKITAVNGQSVTTYWQLEKIIENTYKQNITLTVKRNDENFQTQIPLSLQFAPGYEVENQQNLYHIGSMVPRLKIASVTDPEKLPLKTGDIILAMGSDDDPNFAQYPTYAEMRQLTKTYENKEMPVKVLRTEPNGVSETLTINVTPKKSPGTDRVVMGIAPVIDTDNPVVAKTIHAKKGPAPLNIPAGATITSVGGKEVSDFYDIINEIKAANGKVTIEYKSDGTTGQATLDTIEENTITVTSGLGAYIPFKPLERQYKAAGAVDAMKMGYRRTYMFLAQSIVTLKQALSGLVSPKNFMGPVGIFTMSYKIVADQSIIDYAYFLALISAFIAVFNALPLLPFDGGHMLFLLIEKIKGSPVNEKVQAVVTYTGLVLVLGFALYVTFNDVIRSFSGFFG